MRTFYRHALSLVLFGALLSPLSAEELPSPITQDTQKTQHFVKYMYSNGAAVPVTLRLNASGDNLKTSKPMPCVLVLPARGTAEGFTSSAKDPRAYYSSPSITSEFKFGDYRLSSSNLPLVLPWEAGQSGEVSLPKKANALEFTLPKDAKVLCARQGLVVGIEKDWIVMAHNDGSLTQYSNLGSVKVKLNQQLNTEQELGTAGEKPVFFELSAPTADLTYRALPANFTVKGSKTLLSAQKYTK